MPKTAAVEFPIVCHYVPNNVEIHIAPQAAKRRRNPQCGIISTKNGASHGTFVEIHFAACEAAKAANRARQPLLSEPVFTQLADVAIFRDVYIDHGVTVWADGEIDIAPETLYEMSVSAESAS